MKRIFITAILLVVTALAFAQNNGADKILGVYLSENKTGKVQITQKDGKYIGTWYGHPSKMRRTRRIRMPHSAQGH